MSLLLPALAPEPPIILFPGGGIYYWWQQGVSDALQDRLAPELLPFVVLRGASAGALTATLTSSTVRGAEALAVVSKIVDRDAILDRGPLGLAGIWAGIISEWLGIILPDDAFRRASRHVEIAHVYVDANPKSVFREDRVCNFTSNADLIAACLASCHLPLFLDGRLLGEFRGRRVIDGYMGSSSASAARLLGGRTLDGLVLPVHHSMDSRLETDGFFGAVIVPGDGLKAVERLLDMGREWGEKACVEGRLDQILLAAETRREHAILRAVNS